MDAFDDYYTASEATLAAILAARLGNRQIAQDNPNLNQRTIERARNSAQTAVTILSISVDQIP
jgi:hypothetical protein